jgi:phospholipid/cholesterol/gamma-HCH transport system substrate-binding protein
MAVSGDKLLGDSKPGLTTLVGEKLAPLQEKLDNVLLNANKLLVGINNVLDTKGQTSLKNSLAELEQTMKQFHNASNSLNSILNSNKGKIDGMMTNFDKVSSDFSKVSGSLEKADLGQTAENLKATLAKVDAIMSDVQSGKGSVGKLLKDEQLYKNLTAASKELEQLLADVKNNPKRYVNISVFGRKATPYVAPKTDTISQGNN